MLRAGRLNVPQGPLTGRLLRRGLTRDMMGMFGWVKGGSVDNRRTYRAFEHLTGRYLDEDPTNTLPDYYLDGEYAQPIMRMGGSLSQEVRIPSVQATDPLYMPAGQGEMTIIADVQLLDSANSDYPRVVDISNAGNGTGGYTLSIWDRPGVSGQESTFAFAASGSAQLFGTDFCIPDTVGAWDRPYVIGSRFARLPSSSWADFWVDGTFINEDTGTTAVTFDGTTGLNFCLGNWGWSNDRTFPGIIRRVWMWRRLISDAEMRAAMDSRHCWDYVLPTRRRAIWDVAPAGVDTNIPSADINLSFEAPTTLRTLRAEMPSF